MSKPLEWTEKSKNEHHAHRDKAHYIVYKRSDEKWAVPIYSMFTDAPDQAEDASASTWRQRWRTVTRSPKRWPISEDGPGDHL
jgi:hypothetical protein